MSPLLTFLSGGVSRPSRRRFHFCARRPQRRSRCFVPRRVAPAPGLVKLALLWVLTLRFSAVFQTLRSSAVISVLLPYFYSILYKTTLSQSPRLEDRRPPKAFKDPPPAKRVEWASNRVISEVVLDGVGALALQVGIVRVHTLSLLLLPRAAHDRAAVDSHIQDKSRHTRITRGYSNPRQGGINSVPL